MDDAAKAVIFASQNFFRALDWRQQIAQRVVGLGLPVPRHRDYPALNTAVRLLQAETRCRSSRDRQRLRQRWPTLLAARQLAQLTTPLAWEVRARILAGQSDEEIACRCGVTAETVHWFEALHFCVRDRLDATDWIAGRVIGPGLWRGFTVEEVGKLWSAVGYFGGPLALDAVLAATLEEGQIVLPEPHAGGCTSSTEDVVRQKVLLAVGSMMLSANTPLRQLAQVRVRLRRPSTRPEPAKIVERIVADLMPNATCSVSATVAPSKNRLASMATSTEKG